MPAVLVLTSTYPRRRGDTDPGFVHELCRRLVRRGFRVDVLAPRAPGIAVKEDLDGVTVYRYAYCLRRFEVLAYGGGILPRLQANPLLFLLLPFFLVGQFLSVRRRLRRREYAVLHAHWVLPQALIAAIARGSRPLPLLATSHGSDLLRLDARPLHWLQRWTLRRCDRLSVVSTHLQQVAIAELGADPGSVSVLPMGVDISGRFSVSESGDRSTNRLLCIGRLNAAKGVAHAIDALRIVRERRPDATLDIAGDGPLRNTLENQARSLGLSGAVRFLGAVEQDRVADLLARATVTLVPSLSEGLGLVAVEAMGRGCPVVASDLQGLRDVIDDGNTGFLARPGDPADLARQVLRVLDDPESAGRMAQAARRSVESRFDWETVADAYAELLYDMAGQPADRPTPK